MKNIGLAYTKSQLDQLLADNTDPSNQDASLIGLIFAAGNQFPNELEIRKVYFDPGNYTGSVSFYSKLTNTTKEKLYREDNSGDKLEVSSTLSSSNNDRIEFTNNSDFGFAFFSREELNILKALSNRIIISGGTMNPGMISYPAHNLTSQNPPFATLIAEIDRNDMISIPINSTLQNFSGLNQPVLEELPTIALGMPCPPYWDPAEKIMNLSSKFRRKRANIVKGEKWPKLLWMRVIKKAWFNFTKDLEVEMTRSRCENHNGVRVHKVGNKKKVIAKSKKKNKKVEA